MAFPSYIPLNFEETCQQKMIENIFSNLINYMYGEVRMFEYLTTGKDIRNKKFCEEYVKKYISIVSIETPTDTVTKSTRVRGVSFNQQLAVVGGTLGLFTGISILSIVEIICFCFTILKHISQAGRAKIWKKTNDGKEFDHDKEKKAIRGAASAGANGASTPVEIWQRVRHIRPQTL